MFQRAAATAWLLFLGCGFAACQPSPPEAAEDADDSQRVAVLEGETITQGELDAWIKEQLFREQTDDFAEAEVYELRSRSLQDLIDERVVEAEAERRGISTDELMRLEREALGPISDEQVTAFYEENKQRMGSAHPRPDRARIRSFLDGAARRGTSRPRCALREKAEVLLEPPRIEVSAEGPALGPADAPVTIVEFSDYECPFCKRADPTVTEVMKKYPDKVRLVYRHFPLDNIHPNARPAAEAAALRRGAGEVLALPRARVRRRSALNAATLAASPRRRGSTSRRTTPASKERRHAPRRCRLVADGPRGAAPVSARPPSS